MLPTVTAGYAAGMSAAVQGILRFSLCASYEGASAAGCTVGATFTVNTGLNSVVGAVLGDMMTGAKLTSTYGGYCIFTFATTSWMQDMGTHWVFAVGYL